MRVGQNKLKKNRVLFSFLILFSYIMGILSMGLNIIKAEEIGTGVTPIEKIELVAEVLWIGVPDGVSVPETVVNLVSGEKIIESIKVTNEVTRAEFSPVDKVDSEGNLILYGLTQDAIEGYKTEIKDFVVENTFIIPEVIPEANEEPIPDPPVEEPVTEEVPVVEEEPIAEELTVIEEEPIIEEPIVETTLVTIEEPVVEEPATEEPPVEAQVDTVTANETQVDEAPPVEEEPAAEEKLLAEETAMVENEVLAASDLQVMAASYTYSVNSYFPATGTSTNDHYSVVGVFIGTDNNVYLILDNNKATAQQYRFYDPILNGYQAAGYGLSWQDYEAYWDGATSSPYTTSVYLNYPDSTTQTISGTRMFIFNLGPMTDKLMATNTLSMQNQADGFSIDGMTFTLDLKHTIEKVVLPTTATIGQEVVYTITVTNTGQYQLSGMNIMDTVPNGLTILKVSKDGGTTWLEPFYSSGVLVLDENKTLTVGTPLVYKVKAYVNTDAQDGGSLINRAYTAGSVVTQEDFATVMVQAVDVTVTKNVTGNMSNPSDTFAFTLTVLKGVTSVHYVGETANFNLSDNGTYTKYDLPIDGVVTLSEVSLGYKVTVTVGGVVQVPDENGVYTITLSGADITIDVENNKEVVIPTGIHLDTIPYIMILILLGAAVFSGILWKRKNLNYG